MSSAQPIPTRSYGPFTGGTNAVGTQVDTDLNTLYTCLQAGLGDVHIADNAAIQLSKLQAVAWTPYTPVWSSSGTAVALGNGTITGFYQKVGRTVNYIIKLTMGSTTTFGTGFYTLTLPVATSANYSTTMMIGTGNASLSNQYMVFAEWASSTTVNPVAVSIPTTYLQLVNITNAVPSTWANASVLTIGGSYESAS